MLFEDMWRLLSSCIIASLVLVHASLISMTFFNMHHETSQGTHPCINNTCTTDLDITTDTDCLTHCLSISSSIATVAIPPIMITLLLIGIYCFSQRSLVVTFSQFLRRRWREGIGKLLLQQNLSTVILRD